MEPASGDAKEIGPLTIGDYPQQVYQDYEQRKAAVETAPSYFQESSIIAQTASQDRFGVTYDQLSIENGDVGRNPLFSDIAPPERFSTQALFQVNTIMHSFGPEESQMEDVEKINQITHGKTKSDPILQEGQTLKDCLENIAQLNNIATEVNNQMTRLAKG